MPQVQIYTGTSGWSYSQWKPDFYTISKPAPPQLVQYAALLPAVEINSCFYRLPHAQTLQKWHDITPLTFRFAAKAWKHITHELKLKNASPALLKNLESLRYLQDKLGPILFQLPPSLKRDDALLKDFLLLLPKDLQFAFEFRHISWQDESIYTMLADHNAALCQAHVKEWQSARIITAPFTYIRLHGADAWFKGAYDNKFLHDLRYWIETSGAKEAWVFFNNTMTGTDAPENATTLLRYPRPL